ncbi:hypothetical protein ACFY7C_37130 [Streptomyces sp. NPDC012769]|uniref:hypothetical protein n=1 Tax=Streptomyces sp. NPDC012769 TaxID=3364848 RepID=UPI0036A82346
MSLFTGTAGYYRQYRPGIPDDLAHSLAACAPGTGRTEKLSFSTCTSSSEAAEPS